MLLFSTILSIRPTVTPDDFVKLVIDWNQTDSEHPENVIPGLQWDGRRSFNVGEEGKLFMASLELKEPHIIAIRCEKRDDKGRVWDTDFVLNFDAMQLCVRLERSFTADAVLFDPVFSTPHFITLLINRDYLLPDGELPVLRVPSTATAADFVHLTEFLASHQRYRLPVVYISRNAEGALPLDAEQVAFRLKGAAHVLVEADAARTEERDAFYAAAGIAAGDVVIMYPNVAMRHQRFFYQQHAERQQNLAKLVIGNVIEYSNSLLVDALFTWQGVSNFVLRGHLLNTRQERKEAETARAQAEAQAEMALAEASRAQSAADEAGALVDAVDDELQSYRRQIESLIRANEALTYENQGLRAKLGSSARPVLNMGEEADFYPDEVKDMLLETLEERLAQLDARTRRACILKDVIAANDGCRHLAGARAQEVKTLLKGYKNLSGTMKQALTDLGFVITGDGKHYKLTYYGDPRYCVTLAKTPSDSRSGMNAAMDIVKLTF